MAFYGCDFTFNGRRASTFLSYVGEDKISFTTSGATNGYAFDDNGELVEMHGYMVTDYVPISGYDAIRFFYDRNYPYDDPYVLDSDGEIICDNKGEPIRSAGVYSFVLYNSDYNLIGPAQVTILEDSNILYSSIVSTRGASYIRISLSASITPETVLMLPDLPWKRMMVYNTGNYSQSDVDFSVGEIVEDRIARRYDAPHYGLIQNEPLQFTIVFGIDPDDLSGETCFTRAEVSKITQWLTGHQDYKILTIDQDDMTNFRFHAMVTELKLIADGGLPTAFSAEITCDSPFAYMNPRTYTSSLTSSGALLSIENESTMNGYYYPVFTANLTGASFIQFVNASDGNRTMRIGTVSNPIPSGAITITIDCQNQIISANTGVNLYPGFNMKFLRLVPGMNSITITTDGTGMLSTTCEYPVNIGA